MRSRTDLPGIYAIICLNDDGATVYVGSTRRTVRKRQTAHRSRLRSGKHENQYLQRAWNKYGESSFIFLVLEPVLSLAFLIEREQYWLDQFRANSEVYNVGVVAGSNRTGVSHRPSVVKRIRAALLGRRHNQETKDKISDLLRGHPVSEETRRKLSKFFTGRPGGTKGYKLSVAHKKKLSTAKMGNENRARDYPTFYHRETGTLIPAGRNLAAMCRERGLPVRNMRYVAQGIRKSCLGWRLYKEIQ